VVLAADKIDVGLMGERTYFDPLLRFHLADKLTANMRPMGTSRDGSSL